MGIVHHHNFNINVNPPLPQGTQLSIGLTPQPLLLQGFNLAVEISTATAFRQQPFPPALQSLLVMAHFDTGASVTSIDINLAQHLNLNATGKNTNLTAAGHQIMPTFAIDLSFPNTTLHPFTNLQIGSCNLNFKLNTNLTNPRNFGLLLGRDVMSRWNIVWNGPSSTVIISD